MKCLFFKYKHGIFLSEVTYLCSVFFENERQKGVPTRQETYHMMSNLLLWEKGKASFGIIWVCRSPYECPTLSPLFKAFRNIQYAISAVICTIPGMAPFGMPTTGFCMVFRYGNLVFSAPGTHFWNPGAQIWILEGSGWAGDLFWLKMGPEKI